MKASSRNLIENYRLNFPDVIKVIGEYFKTIISRESVDTLSTATGTIATIIKIFSKPIIDKVISTYDAKQLADFGSETFLKISIGFANSCLSKLLIDEPIDKIASIKSLDKDELITIISEQVTEINVNPIIFFQPRLHPIVKLTKNIYQRILLDSNVELEFINKFLKDFNNGIGIEIEIAFGQNFSKLLQDAKVAHFNEKEAELLNDMICNSKIGFDDKETIDYVETFGEWKKISELENQSYYHLDLEEVKEKEDKLLSVKRLIKQYFDLDPTHNLEKILFLIADFGKGKSVFLRHYAAELASDYLSNSDGYFPIYFNLRDYINFQSDSRLGVIYDFLETRYGIKLEEDQFRNKKYIFLIDSLDESGELTKSNIDNVINSVKRIQNLDKVYSRNNRIVISSRPFDDGLRNHLISNAYYQRQEKKKQENFYLSLYGFKINQFNHWLISLLKRNERFIENSKSTLCKEISKDIQENKIYDIHLKLSGQASLSYEELKRPIFGYMIYQLLINDYDFIKVGKIGVYLSFINLLSKEAKYIHDTNYTFDLVEQFECRSILHSIASLWAHQRVLGKQGSLKKADICRAVEADIIDENDDKVLERFRDKKINEISFLSHSYFGENDNVLHFQHQSFAEMLLAEYYFKVLIKSSLDRTIDVSKVRLKLFVGQPSAQTMEFLKGLILIFRDASSEVLDDEVLEKRKLLFPFISSIALNRFNKELHSENLYYNWFSKFNWNESIIDYPKELLDKWFFDRDKINSMVNLCKEVIDDNTYELLLAKSSKETSIFKEEITKVKPEDLHVRKIDHLLCIFMGNVLVNNELDNVFFMRMFDNESSIRILKTVLDDTGVSNLLRLDCLKGIVLETVDFFYFNQPRRYAPVNFLSAEFNNVSFSQCRLTGYDFSNSKFNNVNFSNCDLTSAIFDNCIFGDCHFEHSTLTQGVLFPYSIAYKIHSSINHTDMTNIDFYGIRVNFGGSKLIFSDELVNNLARLNAFKNIINNYRLTRGVLTKRDILNSLDFSQISKENVKKIKDTVFDYLNLK